MEAFSLSPLISASCIAKAYVDNSPPRHAVVAIK